MTNATNLEELQRLVEKMTGQPSEADSIADAICEITDAYKGSGGGGVSIVSAQLYPDGNGAIQSGLISMSDGSKVTIDVAYIPEFDITSAAGSTAGTTKLTLTNELGKGNSYVYEFDRSPSLPAIGEDMSDCVAWDGTSDITCEDGQQITVIEVDSNKKAVKAGVIEAIIAY